MAAGQTPSPASREALAELCQQYWYPLYAHVRQRGNDPDHALDLTQAFFAKLLEKNGVRTARRDRGRFRTFLLASLDNFLAGEWRKAQAQKRGGGIDLVSIDAQAGEERYAREPVDLSPDASPETAYTRRWAMTLIHRATKDLGASYRDQGKEPLFQALRGYLMPDSQAPYEELAEQLGMSTGSVRTALSRLRKRWRDQMRSLVAETTSSEQQLESELLELSSALQVE